MILLWAETLEKLRILFTQLSIETAPKKSKRTLKMKRILILIVIFIHVIYGIEKTEAQSGTPTISFVSPLMGEVWEADKTYTIKWNTENILSSANMGIGMRPTNRFSEFGDNVITTSTKNTGEYNWTVPNNIPSGVYVITMYDESPIPGMWEYYTDNDISNRRLFTVKERDSQVSMKMINGHKQLEVSGGAIGASYELLLSTNLLDWKRSGQLITNGIPMIFNSTESMLFVRLAVPLPVYAIQGERKVGKPITFTATASGGESVDYYYHWWYQNEDGTGHVPDEHEESITITFTTPGVKTGFLEVFSKDKTYRVFDSIIIEE